MNKPGEGPVNREDYKRQLDDILSTSLTAENINTYSDDALDGLTDLIDKIKNDPAYRWSFSLTISAKEQEDEMLQQILGVNVDDVLEKIGEIGDNIQYLDKVIESHRRNKEQKTYIPTDKLGFTAIVGNGGSFSRSPIVPKTKVALFLLENDFDIDLNNPKEFQMSTGINPKGMMRQISYDIIHLPTLNRVIASCDETGNITFIFDTSRFEEKGVNIDIIKDMTKQDIQNLLENDPTLGVSLRYSKNYPTNLTKLIEQPQKLLAVQIENNPDQFDPGGQYLKEIETITEAPEGWITINSFAREFKNITSPSTIYGYIRKNSLESKRYRTKRGAICQFYRIEDLKTLIDPLIDAEKAPKGWVTVNSFAEKYMGIIGASKIYELIKQNNLEPKKFKAKNGVIRQFYKIEDLKTLIKPLVNLERAPEGWVTINSFAVNRGINLMTLIRFIKEKGPESREYKTENGIRCLHYKIEDLDALVKPLVSTERAPEGWVTIKGFAESHEGITRIILSKLVKESSPESKEYRMENGVRRLHYKIEDLEALVKPLASAERAPKGWVTINGFAESHKGIIRETLSKLAKENSLESREYKTENGVKRLHYRIEDLETLVKTLMNLERAPEGWVTIKGFAKSHKGITRMTLRDLIKKSNLETKEYRAKNGWVCPHYKEEDLQKILAERNRN